MGVTGLWPIIQPCARPIKLETLNRKRLAVDASIWIYQFLKAVRDKEGNALRNSHVVGFFRRICKLLFFGIKPVFVFDGGAPILKRQTVLGRKRRREGRRDDAVRTAGKLLAVQMQRRAEEEDERRKRQVEVRGQAVPNVEEEEDIPDVDKLVYVDEIGMSNQERQQTRKFTKKDAYHLPELNGSIESMGQPNDPRIMSAEELEEYARQFNSGEDINLYDFSNIDFNGDFFTSLPAVDRYNILNAARLRSRLRMGLSKEQLEEMFPNRMDFSRFQIERVTERNELTQRLMNLNGMNGPEAMFGINGGGRIAGEQGREYVLVKNDGVEGGWALGVVSTDKEQGNRNKPIDIDVLQHNIKREQQEEEEDEEDDFEDVPIEGLNRLPKLPKPVEPSEYDKYQAQQIAEQRRQFYASRKSNTKEAEKETSLEDESLFVDGADVGTRRQTTVHEDMEEEDEDEELNRAIAMSLSQNHGGESEDEEMADFEDVPMPSWKQKAVLEPKPIMHSNGKIVAHIVNNRSNAAVTKRRAMADGSDDDDEDLQVALAASRKRQKGKQVCQLTPAVPNVKNPWDGPLPFKKLDFKKSIFGKKSEPASKPAPISADRAVEEDKEMEGGFEREEEDAPKPLPPWLIKEGDIRSDVREQQARDIELNAADREQAMEDQRRWKKDHGIIEIESSDDGSDVEVLRTVPRRIVKQAIDLTTETTGASQQGHIEDPASAVRLEKDVIVENSHIDMLDDTQPSQDYIEEPKKIPKAANQESEEESVEWSDSDRGDTIPEVVRTIDPQNPGGVGLDFLPREGSTISYVATTDGTELEISIRSSPVFENVNISDASVEVLAGDIQIQPLVSPPNAMNKRDEEIVSDIDFDEFSDPDDEELLTQLAIEAEEHARFASTLNNRSERENAEQYEAELKALRNQQRKDRRDADEVSHIMITECQALLRLFGLPYITAPMEAEAQCAELVRLGLVDGIVTDDSDVFLFGGTRVYKNMFNSNKFVECYLSADLEKELSLSRDSLISIAQLLGSDYTEGLAGIGPVTALEIISEFPTSSGLEDFKDWWTHVQAHPSDKAPQSSTFRKKFKRTQGKKLFLPPAFPSPAVVDAYVHPDVDSTPEPFQWGVPDLNLLREFLMSTIGWTPERTDEVLVPVIRDMNRRETEGTQSNITRYFDGAIGVGARNDSPGNNQGLAQGSTRMKEAYKKLKTRKAGGGAIGTPGNLEGNFGDEAREWASRNELSYDAQMKKNAEKSNKGKKRGPATPGLGLEKVAAEAVAEEADGEDNENEDEDGDEDVETRSMGKEKGKRNSTKKVKFSV
jgi:DNA excision repair protein ERCC-5